MINVNMNKMILKAFTLILFSVFLLSCSFKPMDVYFEYPISQQSGQVRKDSVPVKSEKISLIFASGFHSDNVKVILNGRKIFDKKILERIPFCDSFEFNREQKNRIQLYINGHKSNAFEFDEKYDIGTINYSKKENEIIFCYDTTDEMVSFD